MTTATKERKAKATEVKTVQIIARIQFKNDTRKVVYLVRASNGVDQYETYFFDGRALSCTCNSRKPCYHMTQLEAKEAERIETTQVVALAEAYVREEIDEDATYDAWKKAEHKLDSMSRDEYVSVFDPCGMEGM
jgi:hypothetical protein